MFAEVEAVKIEEDAIVFRYTPSPHWDEVRRCTATFLFTRSPSFCVLDNEDHNAPPFLNSLWICNSSIEIRVPLSNGQLTR